MAEKDLIKQLSVAYERGQRWGVNPTFVDYKELGDGEYKLIDKIIKATHAVTRFSLLPGPCLFIHSLVSKLLKRQGITTELVYGDVLVEGAPRWSITEKDLQEQLKEGISDSPQKIHCWLLMPDYSYLDLTIAKEVGLLPRPLTATSHDVFEGKLLEWMPELMGHDFVTATNPVEDLSCLCEQIEAHL